MKPYYAAVIGSSLLAVLLASSFCQSAYSQSDKIQRMPAGGWRANPTFFDATSDDDRRKAILIWFESIKYESWEANNRRDGSYPGGTMGEIREYAVSGFYGIFGKFFLELSKNDKKLIVKWLKKCSKETWVTYGLIQPLTQAEDSPQAIGWANLFKNPKPTPWSLRALGNATYTLNKPNTKALIYAQTNGLFRVELLTSVYGHNTKNDTSETTQINSSLVVASESGQVIRKEHGMAQVVVWLSEGSKTAENRNSITIETRAIKGKLYVFLNELPCRWGVTMRSVTWYDNCAEAGGTRRGHSIHAITENFIDRGLNTLPQFDVPIGQQVEYPGWVGIRIK